MMKKNNDQYKPLSSTNDTSLWNFEKNNHGIYKELIDDRLDSNNRRNKREELNQLTERTSSLLMQKENLKKINDLVRSFSMRYAKTYMYNRIYDEIVVEKRELNWRNIHLHRILTELDLNNDSFDIERQLKSNLLTLFFIYSKTKEIQFIFHRCDQKSEITMIYFILLIKFY